MTATLFTNQNPLNTLNEAHDHEWNVTLQHRKRGIEIMIVRRLTGLHRGIKNPEANYFHFAYYEQDSSGNLKWTGESEETEISDDELYELVKPVLKKLPREVKE